MAHYKLQAEYRRNTYCPDICSWTYVRPNPTFKFDDTTFLLTEEEGFEMQRRFAEGPVDFLLSWIVCCPGGSIADRTIAVKFYHRPSAILFKLSRS